MSIRLHTRQDWVEKVIHWELCKKFKFVHPNECYQDKPEFVLENKMYKILCDFLDTNRPTKQKQ